MSGVALGDIDLKAAFLTGALFLVVASLWNARGFQSAAPVSKSDVLCVGCGKTMYHFVFQRYPKMAVFQSDPVALAVPMLRLGR